MPKPLFRGIMPAIPTPMQPDGAIDEARLTDFVHFLIREGASGIVPIGGTGEYTAQSASERQRVVATTVKAAAGRVPVVAGVLSTGYADAVDAGRAFTDVGADGLLVITPYYARGSQDGMRRYFASYARDVKNRVLAYDIPYRTGVSLTPQTIVALEADGAIVGMKACNTDVAHFNEVAAGVSADFALLSGEDGLFPTHMALGACGGIIASASLLPAYWVRMYELAAKGELSLIHI